MKKESVLLNYVLQNKRVFITILIVFLMGMVFGIFFVNHANSNQVQEIQGYITKLITNIKVVGTIDRTEILLQSITQNVLCIFIIWFLGCTIIGSVFIYIAVAYKGFSLGYTISAVVACLGIKSGTIFTVSALLLQNLVFLPAFFLLSESGLRLYHGMNKHSMNIRSEVFRHTIIMLITLGFAIVSSFIEVYISTNLIIFLKDFL